MCGTQSVGWTPVIDKLGSADRTSVLRLVTPKTLSLASKISQQLHGSLEGHHRAAARQLLCNENISIPSPAPTCALTLLHVYPRPGRRPRAADTDLHLPQHRPVPQPLPGALPPPVHPPDLHRPTPLHQPPQPNYRPQPKSLGRNEPLAPPQSPATRLRRCHTPCPPPLRRRRCLPRRGQRKLLRHYPNLILRPRQARPHGRAGSALPRRDACSRECPPRYRARRVPAPNPSPQASGPHDQRSNHGWRRDANAQEGVWVGVQADAAAVAASRDVSAQLAEYRGHRGVSAVAWERVHVSAWGGQQFGEMYGAVEVVEVGDEDIEAVEAIGKGVKELRSEDWIYLQTPQFTFSSHPTEEDPRERPVRPSYVPAAASVLFTARNGAITEAEIRNGDGERAEGLVGKKIHEITDWRGVLGGRDDGVGRWLNGLFGV
ncbi:hypothetical protein O988_04671 [Pseudogymnoascus sp. VKM F-3808]|nr:hypothetical protein O988_04671 [Pseudogymnoascus sp. VKM F-3808]